MEQANMRRVQHWYSAACAHARQMEENNEAHVARIKGARSQTEVAEAEAKNFEEKADAADDRAKAAVELAEALKSLVNSKPQVSANF